MNCAMCDKKLNINSKLSAILCVECNISGYRIDMMANNGGTELNLVVLDVYNKFVKKISLFAKTININTYENVD